MPFPFSFPSVTIASLNIWGDSLTKHVIKSDDESGEECEKKKDTNEQSVGGKEEKGDYEERSKTGEEGYVVIESLKEHRKKCLIEILIFKVFSNQANK